MKENKERLANKGLSTAGKAADLKARVKEWVDNAAVATTLKAVTQVIVPGEVESPIDSEITTVEGITAAPDSYTMDENLIQASKV